MKFYVGNNLKEADYSYSLKKMAIRSGNSDIFAGLCYY